MFSSTNEALSFLAPFATDEANPLWDCGLLFLSKSDEGVYQIELTGFYFESAKDLPSGDTKEIERHIQILPVHKEVFDYLQTHFSEINPAVKWNRLVLEVRREGELTPHYELNGKEVSPDAPPMPEKITAAYLCENLRNCLAYHAPPGYKWIWEVLERKKTEEGKTQMGGAFFYSLHEDKTDPQKLVPGEYVYMYNVSERLFDEFLSNQTKNWSCIRLEFSHNGSVLYNVLQRDYLNEEALKTM